MQDYYLTISKKELRGLKVKLEYDGPIVAPIQKGEKVANIIISKKDCA